MGKRAIGIVAASLLLCAAGALLFAWSGLYNVGASRGHWPITRWFLEFAMRNSIETHALLIEAPPLDDLALLYLGLGHYEGACTPCHGAPGEPRNPIPLQLVPEPPFLPDVATLWSPEELFWIVKHGLKYTGMPAWPAQQRDDEVWAVVAALVRLPYMDAVEYRRLTRRELSRDPARIRADAELIATAGPLGDDLVACARCHGLDGAGGGAGAFPRLAGLDEAYIYDALRSYAAGSRPSGVMQPIAVELSDAEMRELARYFASIPTDAEEPSEGPIADAETRHLGRRVAHEGIAAAGVPACAPCHGPTDAPRYWLYPYLPGQHAAYLIQQLRLWREGTLATTPQGAVMHAAARGLSDRHIEAVAHYYQHVAASEGRPVRHTREERWTWP